MRGRGAAGRALLAAVGAMAVVACGTTEPSATSAPDVGAPVPAATPPADAATRTEAAPPAEVPATPEVAVPKPELTVVEDSHPLPSEEAGTLATTGYLPTEKEKPWFERLSPDNPILRGSVESIDEEAGAYVAWFGIVRGIREDPVRRETRLYLESKYFDGLTDTHILCLDFNGGGDFVAILGGTGHGVAPLALVRVYGAVASRKDGLPRVEAEYVRQWDWGLFTFMYLKGEQRGSERWRRLAKAECVTDDEIYDPFPDREYFIDRLGPRSSFLNERPDIPTD